jgi:hypothetical protein
MYTGSFRFVYWRYKSMRIQKPKSEHTILLRFLGIIVRVLRLEVSLCNVYNTNRLQTAFAQRGEGE